MALINVAINFAYEFFRFVIYFSEIFFPKFFFQHFFSKFFFSNFFVTMFFPKFFFRLFKKFFFLRVSLDASPFTEKKRTLCICVMKNMIYSKRSKLNFSHV